MSWLEWHQISERLASEASVARRAKDFAKASSLFSDAADAESKALQELEAGKPRTLGVITVSAVSLNFKSGKLETAEALAYRMLGTGLLPQFAIEQLKTLVQAIWTESAKKLAGVTFLPGQVYVSVKGGEVVTGGAPLDLVVDKVQTIQSIFYRTIEEFTGLPLRTRGAPAREIQESCRPWLFQAPPGSYQFSVAIQEPIQKDFFKKDVAPGEIAERFLDILRATGSDDPKKLDSLVPNEGYRATYLKLARNLAPSGKVFESIELSAAGDSLSVALDSESRRNMNSALKTRSRPLSKEEERLEEVTVRGTLRAVDLDKDWIDVSGDGGSQHIVGLKDTLDDVIGPMMNRRVIVHALKGLQPPLHLRDIELDE